MNDLKVKPNPAHEKIANLENKMARRISFSNAKHR